MDPKNFYDHLWRRKQQLDYHPAVQRDWFHRLILDRMVSLIPLPILVTNWPYVC
jgi:hypothetical protein